MRKSNYLLKLVSILLIFTFFITSTNSTVFASELIKNYLKKQHEDTIKIEKKEREFVSSRFIVKYTDDIDENNSINTSRLQNIKSNEKIKKYKGRDDIKTALRDKIISNRNIKNNYDIITIKNSEKVGDVWDELVSKNAHKNIEYIQPDYEIKLKSDDTYFKEQWGLQDNHYETDGNLNSDNTVDTNIPLAWELSEGQNTIIAVIDTAIDINHPDLKNNIWVNTQEINNTLDDDNNGYLSDTNGWNFYDDSNIIYDPDSPEEAEHGTHISGIIGAQKDNGIGIAGVAPKARILPLVAFKNGKAYTSDIIEAIYYAESKEASIVNCSWGSEYRNPALENVIQNSGMLFICSAGNDGLEKAIYPAAYDMPNVISVAAMDINGQLASFSNFGLKVHLAAPGVDIFSTLPKNKYGNKSGTSIAAPTITGIAALLYSYKSDLTANDMAVTIKSNVTMTGTLSMKVLSSGYTNAYSVLSNIIRYTGLEKPIEDTEEKEQTLDEQLMTLSIGVVPWQIEQIHYGEIGVNPAFGNFSRSYTDMSIESSALNINVSRTYNSKDEQAGRHLGKGWSFAYEGSVKKDENNDSRYIVKLPDGRVEAFVAFRGNIYVPDAISNSSRDTLVFEESHFTLITSDQYSYTFSPEGWLTEIKDRTGNSIKINVNSENGKISSIIDQVGRVFQISYNSNNGFVENIIDVSGNRTVIYQYNTKNRLEKVIDPMSNVIATYIYDSNGYLTMIKDANQKVTEEIAYDHVATDYPHKVKTQKVYITDTLYNTYTYHYDKANRKTTITDSNNRQTIKWYDEQYFITKTTDPEQKDTIVDYYTEDGALTWQRRDNSNVLGRNLSAVASYNNNVYVLGGEMSFTYLGIGYGWSFRRSAVESDRYNTINNSWATSNILSGSGGSDNWGRENAAAAELNGKLYIAGGSELRGVPNQYLGETFFSSVHEYNGSTWTIKASLQHPRILFSLVELNGALYAIGGTIVTGPVDSTVFQKTLTVEKYTGTSWTSVADTIYHCSGNYSRTHFAAAVNGKIYAQDINYNLEQYDPATNTWTIYDTNSPEGDLLSLNNTLFCVNGNKGIVHRYNIQKKSWEISESFFGERGRDGYAVISCNGKIYVVLENNSHYLYFDGSAYHDYNWLLEGTWDGTKKVNRYGDIKAVTDRNGNKTTYERDGRGNITKIINPDQSYKEYKYDEKNNLISERDEEGKLTFYVYDSTKINLIKVAKPLNGTDEYIDEVSDINKFAIISNIYYTEAECQALGYLQKGLIKTVIDPNGKSTTYTYDQYGNIRTITDPENNTSTSEYNSMGLRTAEITPLIYRTEYIYDKNGRLVRTTVKNPDDSTKDSVTRVTYNAKGQTDKVISPNLYNPALDGLNSSPQNFNYTGDHGTRYTYYASGLMNTVKDAEGNTTTYIDYDKYGNLQKEEKPNHSIYTYNYDIMNRLQNVYYAENQSVSPILLEEYTYKIENGVTLPDGSILKNTTKTHKAYSSTSKSYTTVSTYNFAGLEIKQVIGDSTIKTDYYKNGLKKTVTDPKNNTIIYNYDGLNRIKEEHVPFCIENSVTYYSKTTHDYDKNGNELRLTTSSNKPGEPNKEDIIEYEYDSRNLLVKVTTFDDYAPVNYTQYYYDKDRRKVRMYTGLNSKLQINGLDNIVEGSDHEYSITKYEYNHLNKLTMMTDPSGKAEKYTQYDLDGNLKKLIDRNSHVITMDYDNLDQLLNRSVVTLDGLGNTSVTYTYDSMGNRESMTNGDGSQIIYSHDGLGRLLTETDNALNIIKSYTYDYLGNRESFTLNQNSTEKIHTTYDYDNMSRLWHVYENGQLAVTYSYDLNGNRETMSYTNGNSTKYVYNLANKVTSIENKKDTDIISQYTYTYYLNGNQRTKEDISGKVTEYQYDGLGRLVSEVDKTNETVTSSISYTYDDSNNRSTMMEMGSAASIITSYDYDINNRLKKETKTVNGEKEITNYYYDGTGNQTCKTKSVLKNIQAGETESIEMYKAEDAMESYATFNEYNGFNQLVKVSDGSNSYEYSYNGDGLRTSKTVNGTITNHIWDGDQIALELNGAGTVTNKYVRGINLIYAENTGGTKQYYLFNGHGDVVQLTNSTTGDVVKTYNYDAFGVEKNPDDNDTNVFRYCGEYFDKETGTIYLRARYYDPTIGRFISEDSYWGKDNDPLSLNLYTYCHNDPIDYIDPSGNSIKGFFGGFIKSIDDAFFGGYAEKISHSLQSIFGIDSRTMNEIYADDADYQRAYKAGSITNAVVGFINIGSGLKQIITSSGSFIVNAKGVVVAVVSGDLKVAIKLAINGGASINGISNAASTSGGDLGGLVKGKPGVSKGSEMIRSDKAKVNSQEFKDFIRNQGKSFKENEWEYRMETWENSNGSTYERHYWVNKKTGESYYHK